MLFRSVLLGTLVILITCSTLSFLSYKKSAGLIEASYIDKIQSDISFLDETLKNLLENAKRNANLIAGYAHIKEDMVAEDFARMNELFELVAENSPEIINILYSAGDKIHIYPYTDMLDGLVPSDLKGYTEYIDSPNFEWEGPYIDEATVFAFLN